MATDVAEAPEVERAPTPRTTVADLLAKLERIRAKATGGDEQSALDLDER